MKDEIQGFEYESYCPYRVCPLGAHIDHQHGIVTGFALNRGVHLFYNILEKPLIKLTSKNFDGIFEYDLNADLPDNVPDSWGKYVFGAIKILSRKYTFNKGIEGCFSGDIPIGGLSSSSAIILSFIKALFTVNNLHISDNELINTVCDIERIYIGVSVGKLDPATEILSKKDKLLVYDTNSDKYFYHDGPDRTEYEFMIIYSGVERSLKNSAYNIRVDECKAVGFYCNMVLNNPVRLSDTYLRDISFETFKDITSKHKTLENLQLRATHFYTEMERVQDGIIAWSSEDLIEFGQLVIDSGNSSINNYHCGSEILNGIHNIIIKMNKQHNNYVYGGRFMGGGFNGCYMAIINPGYREAILETFTKCYEEEYPEMCDKYSIYMCKSSDGLGKI